MPGTIFRLSTRRMSIVANNRKQIYRLFTSTTNNTTTSSENGNVNKPDGGSNGTKHDSNMNSVTSSAVENQTSKKFRVPDLSTMVPHKMPSNTTTAKAADSSVADKKINSNDAGRVPSGTSFRSVYVHPLSQIVLEYMQESHHGWIVAKGMDRSLTIHRDGSFELKHKPQQQQGAIPTPRPPRPPSSNIQKKDEQNSNSEPIVSTLPPSMIFPKNDQIQSASTTTKGTSDSVVGSKKEKDEKTTFTPSIDGNDNLRIWTSYDEEEKKHWLTVRRGLFRQRFLLQDNLLTAWQSNRGQSLQERLHAAVDDMITAVNQNDQQRRAQQMGQLQWKQKGPRRFRKR